jgi:hypothetical protein
MVIFVAKVSGVLRFNMTMFSVDGGMVSKRGARCFARPLVMAVMVGRYAAA